MVNPAFEITVLDRTGTHTALYVPPPSRQLRAPTAAPRFDRAAIMTRAWADYRAAVRKGWTPPGKFDAERWSYCLAFAWMLAKVEVKKAADMVAMAARIASYSAPVEPVALDPIKAARIAQIKGELLAIEYSDAFGAAASHASREFALRAELARLAA